MKEDMKLHTCKPNTTTTSSSSSALALRDESHTIPNFKPKIRIIHIFAPEIIKTDVANFRELVQRLTGKPVRRKSAKLKASSKKLAMSTAANHDLALSKLCYKPKEEENESYSCTGGRYQQDSARSNDDQRIKGEMEEFMWRTDDQENSSFFGGFGDLDGFIQGLAADFPLVPMNASRLDAFGEGREASLIPSISCFNEDLSS